jgi:hypothetical protein
LEQMPAKHPNPLAQTFALLQSAPLPGPMSGVQVRPMDSLAAWQTCPAGHPQAGRTLQVPPASG